MIGSIIEYDLDCRCDVPELGWVSPEEVNSAGHRLKVVRYVLSVYLEQEAIHSTIEKAVSFGAPRILCMRPHVAPGLNARIAAKKLIKDVVGDYREIGFSCDERLAIEVNQNESIYAVKRLTGLVGVPFFILYGRDLSQGVPDIDWIDLARSRLNKVSSYLNSGEAILFKSHVAAKDCIDLRLVHSLIPRFN